MKIPFLYSVRNLLTRRLTTVFTAGGMALVVFVFASLLMLSEGLKKTLVDTGSEDNLIVIRKSSTSEVQSPWISSGFLALGAATVKSVVSEAAKPFDAQRDGTILGSGAVGIVVERADRVRERGPNGQAEILGTHIGNSAFHATRIDVAHMTDAMERCAPGLFDWLDGLPQAVRWRDVLFVHGGLPPGHTLNDLGVTIDGSGGEAGPADEVVAEDFTLATVPPLKAPLNDSVRNFTSTQGTPSWASISRCSQCTPRSEGRLSKPQL